MMSLRWFLFAHVDTMPLPSLYLTLSLYFLSKFVTIHSYTYQTEPLFLSFSDLAALEAISLSHKAEKTFVVKCHEDSIEVVMKARLFDPGRPVEPTHFRLGPLGAAGGDHCRAREAGGGEFIIRAPLAECGSKVTVSERENNQNIMLVLLQKSHLFLF